MSCYTPRPLLSDIFDQTFIGACVQYLFHRPYLVDPYQDCSSISPQFSGRYN